MHSGREMGVVGRGLPERPDSLIMKRCAGPFSRTESKQPEAKDGFPLRASLDENGKMNPRASADKTLLLEGTFKNMLDCCKSYRLEGGDTPCFPRECCCTIFKANMKTFFRDSTSHEKSHWFLRQKALGSHAHS